MEREGKGEGRGRREMRRGLIVGGMILGLLMGCNNGIAELAAEKRLGEIGRSAENVFYSFIDLIAGTLGFTVKADTTKQQVGQHFTALGTKIGETSAKLEEVAVKAVSDGDKDGLLSKAIREAVNAAKATLNTLKTHLDNLGTVGGDSLKIGEAASNTQGDTVDKGELKKTINALKGIVELAKDSKAITELKTSDAAVSTISGSTNGAKILATSGGAPSANDEGKATAILSKVSGEEILSAIIASTGNESELSGTAQTSTTAAEFALGGTGTNAAQNAAKISAVAGGIALRSLVKNGKLASETNGKAVAEGVGKNAANKLLFQVEDIIKKTVEKVIEKAKGEIDKARDSKATVQQ